MMMDPERLKASHATKLERRLLAAAGDERPSPELTNRMRQTLGLSTSGAAATALAATKATGLTWISAGVVAAVIVGGVVGVWTSHRRVVSTGTAPLAAPVQCAAALPEPASPSPVEPSLTTRQDRQDRQDRTGQAGRLGQNRNRLPVAALQDPSRGGLRDEIALVDEVRTALEAQSPKRALALLRRYAVAYPDGTLSPEAEALRVEALDGSGQHRLAQSLARDFVSKHPDSPLAERVGRSIEDRP